MVAWLARGLIKMDITHLNQAVSLVKGHRNIVTGFYRTSRQECPCDSITFKQGAVSNDGLHVHDYIRIPKICELEFVYCTRERAEQKSEPRPAARGGRRGGTH